MREQLAQAIHMEGEYHVYVIECQEGRRYIGLTSDLTRRLNEHKNGESGWTKRFNGWKIIFSREFACYSEARKFKIFLKKQKGGEKFRKIIQRDGAIGSSRGS